MEERHAQILKELYGENFFTEQIRRTYGPFSSNPTTFSETGEMYGLLSDLNVRIADYRNRAIRNNIGQILINLRNDEGRNRAITLLTNLGLTYEPPPRAPPVNQRPNARQTNQVRRRDIEPIEETTSYEPPSKRQRQTANSEPEECAICLSDMTNQTDNITTNCNHNFHRNCMSQVRPDNRGVIRCPLCRTQVSRLTPYAKGGKRRNKSRKCLSRKGQKTKKKCVHRKLTKRRRK